MRVAATLLALLVSTPAQLFSMLGSLQTQIGDMRDYILLGKTYRRGFKHVGFGEHAMSAAPGWAQTVRGVST